MPVGRLRYDLLIVLVCMLASAGVLAGLFAPLDDALRDLRFGASMRPATTGVVVVEVDSEAIVQQGPLPWPRTRYADLIERLDAAGVATIVLDIDLQRSGGYFEDSRLISAMQAARADVHPAGHRTLRWTATGLEEVTSLPDGRFAADQPPVVVDDLVGSDGRVRSYRVVWPGPDGMLASAGAALSGVAGEAGYGLFAIDYGIDVSTIPRVSAGRVLAGTVDTSGLFGAHVYVGVSAPSAGATVTSSPQGMISTGMLQALAAESIRQERMLVPAGTLPVIAIIFAIGAALLAMGNRLSIGSAVAGVVFYAALLEFLALALHVHTGLLLNTVAIHIAAVGLLLVALAKELERNRHSISSTVAERDTMRGILTRIVADNFDGVVVVDRNLTIRAASRLAEDLIAPNLEGQAIAHVLPEPFRLAIVGAFDSGAMEATAETTITCADGAPRLVEYVVTLSGDDGGEEGAVACLTFRDVTERHQVQERLAYLASHDPTTGAASRTRLMDIAESLLDTPAKRRRGANVMVVAPSRLKTVNDTLGHAYGDKLLTQIVARLAATEAACVARLEGNAFAVLRAGTLTEDEGRAYADHLLEMLAQPYDLDGHHAIIGCNAGMTDSLRSGPTPEQLIAHANMALSVATDLPGDNWAMFAPEMDRRVKHKQDMEVALRAALSKGEFSVHYQPQVDLDTSDILGVEALTRWKHPDLGDVSPAMFIPAAEETGLILELGRWVLQAACCEVASWPRPVTLSVNVSPMQFEYGNVVADVRAALAASGLEAKRLVIEITESLLITETSRFTRQLEALRREGVQVALDDFGTGYSSLSYLGKLPVDKIKIDQSFVRGLPGDKEATAIIRAVLMLSESLGKDVVAEGIETADQAWMLRLAGCRIGQGYHFGRPAVAADILARFAADAADKMPGVRIAG